MNNLVINAGGRFTPAHSKPRTAKRSYQKTYILGIKVLALNMRQNDTGLRHLVYISPNNCNSHHGPRIKVQYGYSEQVSKYAPGFSINVGRNPHVVAGDLKRVKKEVDPVSSLSTVCYCKTCSSAATQPMSACDDCILATARLAAPQKFRLSLRQGSLLCSYLYQCLPWLMMLVLCMKCTAGQPRRHLCLGGHQRGGIVKVLEQPNQY